uniref:Peptidase S72 domain-containing protein n=1 Tax=Caenorhabditis tropicalis TaxID=1561998 RepID=A0A1I7TCS6_9PELO
MRVLLFLLLFVHLTDTVSYHPLQDYKLHINGSAEYRNFSINASTLFSEIVLHPKIFLCIENQLDSNVSIHLWNYVHESFKNTLDLDHKLTAVGKTLITDWNRVIENGLKISVDTHGTNATGYLIFKKCRRDLFTTLGNNVTSALRTFQIRDNTIHVPFVISQGQNVTKYVDFSTILPRRVLAGNNWQIKAFCINATIFGNVKVHMSRCKYSKQFSLVLNVTRDRQLVRYWNDFISLDEKCPIHEETLADQLRGAPGAETSEGKLYNDLQSTVAFNILKGKWISRNVNLQPLLRQGMDNIRVELKQMFNCTGFIQLYISRCEFSPKLKLFAPMKIGSATFDKETVNYISALFNDTSCLNDYQGKRYEYRTKDKYGLYFHIEALEDSIGYTAIYESFRAKLIYHEIENEEYVEGERDTSVVNIFRIMKPLEVTTEMVISYLLDRTRLKPPVSLRLYVSATAPIELSFSQCRSETKRDWKKIGSNINESVIAWYTFDSEGVDLLRGLTDSPNCQDKPYPRIFLHVKSEKRNNLNFEFSIVNGTDLNVVHSCETSEQLKLEATKLQNQALLVLMHFTLIVIIILGVGSIVLIVKQMRKSGYKKKEKTNQIELTTVPPTELFVPVPNLIDY